MNRRISVKVFTVMVMLAYMAVLTGCSSSIHAIKNRELQIEAKMSETIFLDAETLTEAPKVFVRVANTSDFQEIDFADLIRQNLGRMGYSVTSRARDAQYHVTANLLYMGEKKEGIDPDAMLRAGFGGAVLGGTVGAITGARVRDSRLAGAGAVGLIAGTAVAGGEALVGGIFHVDEYFGIVDLQIKEEVEGGIAGTQTASIQDGTDTTLTTTRSLSEKRQEFRTRILVKAKQTRMDRAEAAGAIADRLADQISGMFRI